MVPGVRPAGAEKGDQKRVATPGEAIQAGADLLVVGRPILAAKDRVAAARAIVAEDGRGSSGFLSVSRYGQRLAGQIPFDRRSVRSRSQRARSSGVAGSSVSGTASRRARVRFSRPSRYSEQALARRRPVSML